MVKQSSFPVESFCSHFRIVAVVLYIDKQVTTVCFFFHGISEINIFIIQHGSYQFSSLRITWGIHLSIFIFTF